VGPDLYEASTCYRTYGKRRRAQCVAAFVIMLFHLGVP